MTELPAGFDATRVYDESYFRGGQRDGYGDYLASEVVLRREFRRVLDHIAGFGPSSGRLLELGCAYGFFLREAAGTYESIGVDVSDAALAYCRARGLTAYRADDPAWESHAPYDVIVMLDCIEHLADPEAMLDSVRRTSKKGSLLVLTTGDWASMYARLARTHWRLMTPPQHLYFYSVPTIRRLLTRFGFRVLEARHPWKVVPLGLMAYQVASRLGFRLPNLPALDTIGFPVNLFDAMRVVARREE